MLSHVTVRAAAAAPAVNSFGSGLLGCQLGSVGARQALFTTGQALFAAGQALFDAAQALFARRAQRPVAAPLPTPEEQRLCIGATFMVRRRVEPMSRSGFCGREMAIAKATVCWPIICCRGLDGMHAASAALFAGDTQGFDACLRHLEHGVR